MTPPKPQIDREQIAFEEKLCLQLANCAYLDEDGNMHHDIFKMRRVLRPLLNDISNARVRAEYAEKKYDEIRKQSESARAPVSGVDEVVSAIIQDVAELPDRTSPEDWPEAMLVTAKELSGIIRKHVTTPLRMSEDAWQPIEEAPCNEAVMVETEKGYRFPARFNSSGAVNDKEETCGCWVAEIEGFCPPCWSDDTCWESNADDVASDHPVKYRALREAEQAPSAGKEDGE